MGIGGPCRLSQMVAITWLACSVECASVEVVMERPKIGKVRWMVVRSVVVELDVANRKVGA